MARPVPGDAILHPLALASVAVLVLNDHVLKQAWPGVVTGKLSDFAGLVFFPLLLVGVWEVARAVARRRWGPSRTAGMAAVGATAISFAAVKAVPAATGAWNWGLGAAQWAVGLPAAIQGTIPAVRPTSSLTDPTDLVALPALIIASWIVIRRASPRESTSDAA